MEKRSGIDAVHNFWEQVWQSPQNYDAIVVEDFLIISGGRRIEGREAFKKWAEDFSAAIGNFDSEIVDSFENRDGPESPQRGGSLAQTTEPSAQSLTAAPSS